jgi:hypothetical protein
MLNDWNDVATVFAIMTTTALFVGYIVDRFYVSVRLRGLRQQLQAQLQAQTAGVMGETEQIWEIAKYWLELGFTYARIACYGVFVLVPLMIGINIYDQGAYMGWNLGFTILIMLLAVKMVLRWDVFFGSLGLGGIVAVLQSTETDQKDVTIGALKGLMVLLKITGGVIVAVWLLSIALSVVSWHENPHALLMIAIGLSGYYIFTTLRGHNHFWWLLDFPVIAIFLGVAAYGGALQVGIDLTGIIPDVKAWLQDHNLTFGSIVFLCLIGAGVYFITNKDREET